MEAIEKERKNNGAVKQKKTGKAWARSLFLFLIAFVFLLPVLFLLGNSFLSPEEVISLYGEGGEKGIRLFPREFSLLSYYQVFLGTPEYLLKFWRSLGLSLAVSSGQVLIACLGGAAFAKYSFRGKKVFFVLLVLCMFLPVQAILVPDYLILDQLHLIGSYWALILPNLFAPFGIVLLTFVFREIPGELVEAARLDGAGTFPILTRILMPCGKAGIVTVFVLGFLDSWNMVEQPMVFLETASEFPLSVFLASMQDSNLALQFACAVLCLLPVTLLFLFFNEELSEGMVSSWTK